MNDSNEDEKEQGKKFKEEYLLSKKPIELMEKILSEFDKEEFRQLQKREKGFKGSGGGP